MKIIAIIPARSGSKGIPNKNIIKLGGCPLIGYAIRSAQQAKCVTDIFVSTDSESIRLIAAQYGAETSYLRPAELALDTSPSFPVVEHALKWLEKKYQKVYDYMLLIQPTCPFRQGNDIDAAWDMLRANKDGADSLVSLTKMEEPHPVKLKKIAKGFVLPYHEGIQPVDVFRRQELESVYALNGAIYLCRIPEMLQRRSFMGLKTIPYLMPWERSVNVDSEINLRLAQSLVKNTQEEL